MSPQPRKVSDEQVFAAVMRAMQRLDPRRLTLAAIGEEAGITAGALAQRFGSKRALLLALARRQFGGSGRPTAARATEQHGSAMAALDAHVLAMSSLGSSADTLRRNLAYLQDDLADPAMREALAEAGEANRGFVRSLLEAARDEGALAAHADPPKLALLIEACLAGAAVSAAFYEPPSAGDWVRDLMEELLRPYRTGGMRSSA